jgi:hypothetical protein
MKDGGQAVPPCGTSSLSRRSILIYGSVQADLGGAFLALGLPVLRVAVRLAGFYIKGQRGAMRDWLRHGFAGELF